MMILGSFPFIGAEHLDKLTSALVAGLSTFLTVYLPMILGFSLIAQQDKIGKTLIAWFRALVTLQLRRLRRMGRDAESLTLFWFFTVKLRPATRTRQRKRAADKTEGGDSKVAIKGTGTESPNDRGEIAA